MITGLSMPAVYAAEYDADLYSFCADVLNSLEIPVDTSENMMKKVSYSQFAKMLDALVENEDISNIYMSEKLHNSYLYMDYSEAAKILVSLLGWNFGNQADRYMSIANQVGLSDNVVNKEDKFLVYDVVIMFYNALTADTLEQTVYGTDAEYEKGGITLAEKYKHAVKFEGRLIGNRYSTMYDNMFAAKDEIIVNNSVIGNMIFKTNFDTYSLLGRNVEGFYLEEKGKDKKQLLSVKPKLEDDVLSLSYENRPYYIDNQIRYIVNNKEKKISLEFATDVIYNGQYTTQNTGQFLQRISEGINYGLSSLTIVDCDEDGKYDLVAIECYKTMVVEGKSSSVFKVYSDKNEFLSYDEEYQNGRLSLVDIDGKPFEYKELQKGDILSIFEGASNEKAVKIIVNDNMISAAVNGVCSGEPNNYEFKVKTDDTEEIQNLEFAYSTLENNVSLGEFYDLYLDHTGRIARAKRNTSDGVHYGLFVEFFSDLESSGKDKFKAMIMTDLNGTGSSKLQLVELQKNAKFNGINITTSNYKAFNLELFHTVVMYYTTSDGKIKKIVGADSGIEGSLITKNKRQNPDNENTVPDTRKLMFSKGAASSAMFSATNSEITSGTPYTNISFGIFDEAGTNIAPFNGCKVIGIPDIAPADASTSYGDDYYKVLNFESAEYFHLTAAGDYKITAYYEQDAVVPTFVVYTMPLQDKPSSNIQMTITDKILIVNDVSHVINPITETVSQKIECMYGGKMTTVYSKDEGVKDYTNDTQFINLSEGDLIIPAFDANGMVTYAFMFYDYNSDSETGDIPSYINSGTYSINNGYSGFNSVQSDYFIKKGYVYNIGATDCGIILADSISDMENGTNLYGFAKPIKHMYVYDTKQNNLQKRITNGKMSPGITFFEDSMNTSVAVVRHRSGNCLDVVIYK